VNIFPIGSRVKRNPLCRIGAGRKPDRIGTVMSYSNVPNCVRVQWDGVRYRETYSASFLISAPHGVGSEGQPATVAEKDRE
jgi:hypothetical protein